MAAPVAWHSGALGGPELVIGREPSTWLGRRQRSAWSGLVARFVAAALTSLCPFGQEGILSPSSTWTFSLQLAQ